jgi:hypothetical protein
MSRSSDRREFSPTSHQLSAPPRAYFQDVGLRSDDAEVLRVFLDEVSSLARVLSSAVHAETNPSWLPYRARRSERRIHLGSGDQVNAEKANRSAQSVMSRAAA